MIRVRATLTAAAAGCGAGAGWSIGSLFAALSAASGGLEFSGLITEASGLVSFPFPGVRGALAVGIVSTVGLAAFLGSSGTLIWVRKGFDTRLRVLELGFLIAVVVLLPLFVPSSLAPDGALSSVATAGRAWTSVLFALQTVVAWAVAWRFGRWALLATESFASAQELSADRQGTSEASSTPDLSSPQPQSETEIIPGAMAIEDRAKQDLARMLAVLGICWAFVSYVAPGQSLSSPGVLGWTSALLFVFSAILYLVHLNQLAVAVRLRMEGFAITSYFRSRMPASVTGMIATLALAAALLPANLSPLHLRDANRWMERFTQWIGPLFVPRSGPGRILVDALQPVVGMTGGGPGGVNGWATVVQIGLVTALAVFIVRIFRGRGYRSTGSVGSTPVGFRWLFLVIKEGVLKFAARIVAWFSPRGATVLTQAAAQARSSVSSRPRSRRKFHTIPGLYLYVLERMGRRGFSRDHHETPYEFLKRWRLKVPNGKGMAELTDLFVSVRYAGEGHREDLFLRARKAASQALRGLRQAAIASRLFPWWR